MRHGTPTTAAALVIAAFAILRLGAVVVNINPSYTAREVLIVTGDSGLRILVTLDALAPLIAGIRGKTPIEHVIVRILHVALNQRMGVHLAAMVILRDSARSTFQKPGPRRYAFGTLPHTPGVFCAKAAMLKY